MAAIAGPPLQTERIVAVYLIETPLDPAHAADVLAGEQSCGTFARVQGETDELRARARATVDRIEELPPATAPSLPNAWLERQAHPGPWRRARVRVSFPVANIGDNLPTLAATVAGNLYDLGEVRAVAGTRRLTGVAQDALLGTIIKPNVGLAPQQTADLVAQLCRAGVDFIKDDEVCANPDHAPLAQRVPAVMAQVRRHRDRTGKQVMVAFNISDEIDAMRRHAELVAREEGTCVMVSLNWCGLSAVQALRRDFGLVIHGHRNGYGAFSRHPLLGMSFNAYQAMWRLAGVDHMHVHGLQGKFSQSDEEVVESAHDCLRPLDAGTDGTADLTPSGAADDDRVMPAFSSGQWAGTVPATWQAVRSSDLLFMSGGGILAHPDGPAAGVASIRQAWVAARQGVTLEARAGGAPELRRALDFFGRRA